MVSCSVVNGVSRSFVTDGMQCASHVQVGRTHVNRAPSTHLQDHVDELYNVIEHLAFIFTVRHPQVVAVNIQKLQGHQAHFIHCNTGEQQDQSNG